LDELIWYLVRVRWAEVGTPDRVTLVPDSTVAVRDGSKQADARATNQRSEAARAIIRSSRLGSAGVYALTVRLDKGFFGRAMVECLEGLGVACLLKVPDHHWVRDALGPMRRSLRAWRSRRTRTWPSGRRAVPSTTPDSRPSRGDAKRVPMTSSSTGPGSPSAPMYSRTSPGGLHSLTAWRAYNDGGGVEQRIEDLTQLGAGRSAQPAPELDLLHAR